METWGSHCPRHPVWEDALDGGLVSVTGNRVTITPAGRRALATRAA
jgi:hypothetical protein